MGSQLQQKTQGRTTLLEAVNVCLENIGEQPIDNLENEQIQDARVAQRTILEVHKEGQTKGWSWNSEYNYPFERDTKDGVIKVPESVVGFSVSRYSYNGRYQLRGVRVYDLLKRTFLVEQDSLEADVIFLLPWDSVPEAFNRWATIRGARIFSDRTLGSDALFKYTSKDEADAQAELERIELEQEQSNILSGPYAFPTYQPHTGLMNRRASTGYSIF